jgi:hypothetical protein
MPRSHKFFNTKGVMILFIVALAAISSGCIRDIKVDCGNCGKCGSGSGSESGSDPNGGPGGCFPKSYVGVSVNGVACKSGSACRFPNNACDQAHPDAKCTTTITPAPGQVCACNCQ